MCIRDRIFGVDIDPLAIEVTKFSLLLKVLEDSSAEELDAYHVRTVSYTHLDVYKRQMHSYTEYSPSGNGLHILFSAKGFQYDTKRFYIMNHQAGIEAYVAGATSKYVTVTGNRCEDYEYGDRTQELQVLLDKFMCRPEVCAENAINAKNSDLSMEQLLQLAKSSKNGACLLYTSLARSTATG